MIKVLIFIIIMGAVIGFFWHEQVGGWVEKWQQKAEEAGPAFLEKQSQQAKDWWEAKGAAWADAFVAKLTAQGKVKIDEWLQTKNLNQYGDKKDAVYTGGSPRSGEAGTPLFNEATGQSLDRYAYLLQKFPDLVKELNLERYLK